MDASSSVGLGSDRLLLQHWGVAAKSFLADELIEGYMASFPVNWNRDRFVVAKEWDARRPYSAGFRQIFLFTFGRYGMVERTAQLDQVNSQTFGKSQVYIYAESRVDHSALQASRVAVAPEPA